MKNQCPNSKCLSNPLRHLYSNPRLCTRPATLRSSGPSSRRVKTVTRHRPTLVGTGMLSMRPVRGERSKSEPELRKAGLVQPSRAGSPSVANVHVFPSSFSAMPITEYLLPERFVTVIATNPFVLPSTLIPIKGRSGTKFVNAKIKAITPTIAIPRACLIDAFFTYRPNRKS
jgi:hypothetical protein